MQVLTIEQKKMVIVALQKEIDGYKKKIVELQSIVKAYTLEQDNSVSTPIEKNKKTKKENGWISKIKAVLQISSYPLTSREILEIVLIDYPELDNGSNLMGSLSPALNSAVEDGILKRHKEPGSFAKFELEYKNVIGLNNAINQ